MDELETLLVEVCMEGGVDAADEMGELEDHALDARLGVCVVVLNRVDELREAPVCVGLHLIELLLRESVHINLGHLPIARKVLREEGEVKGRDQVVDALHVATRGVAQRPNVEDALCAGGEREPILGEERFARKKNTHRSGDGTGAQEEGVT